MGPGLSLPPDEPQRWVYAALGVCMNTPPGSFRNTLIGLAPFAAVTYFRFIADLPAHWDWRIGAVVALCFLFPFHNLSPAAISTTATRATALWGIADKPLLRAAAVGVWVLAHGDVEAARVMRVASAGWVAGVLLLVL